MIEVEKLNQVNPESIKSLGVPLFVIKEDGSREKRSFVDAGIGAQSFSGEELHLIGKPSLAYFIRERRRDAKVAAMTHLSERERWLLCHQPLPWVNPKTSSVEQLNPTPEELEAYWQATIPPESGYTPKDCVLGYAIIRQPHYLPPYALLSINRNNLTLWCKPRDDDPTIVLLHQGYEEISEEHYYNTM